jgi:peptidoglycan/xylan/chitin deacetylase (PgdA/CDA1 family)
MIEKIPLLAWPPGQVLTILIFHRVLTRLDPLRPSEPDAKRFDALMRFMASNFTVLPLVGAVDLLERGKLPRRACCITFDDGYADNLTIAQPILEKYGLPATVFVATGYLDGGRMFNDAVIDAIAATAKPMLDLSDFDLGQHALQTLEEKQAAVAAILNQIKFRPPQLRDEQLHAMLERTECGLLPKDIMLTSAQVQELARRGVEIGGHTVAHTILTTLDNERALEEMCSGRQRLEELLAKPVTSFAYPNGKPVRDYAARHVAMARAAGFERALSTASGAARETSDIFQLPRFTPWASNLARAAVQLTRNAWSKVCVFE